MIPGKIPYKKALQHLNNPELPKFILCCLSAKVRTGSARTRKKAHGLFFKPCARKQIVLFLLFLHLLHTGTGTQMCIPYLSNAEQHQLEHAPAYQDQQKIARDPEPRHRLTPEGT